jgi:hypothetical protein
MWSDGTAVTEREFCNARGCGPFTFGIEWGNIARFGTTVLNLQLPWNTGNFVTLSLTVSFWIILLHNLKFHILQNLSSSTGLISVLFPSFSQYFLSTFPNFLFLRPLFFTFLHFLSFNSQSISQCAYSQLLFYFIVFMFSSCMHNVSFLSRNPIFIKLKPWEKLEAPGTWAVDRNDRID